MKIRTAVILTATVIVSAILLVAMQQTDPEIPGFFSTFFSEKLIGAVGATIAASKTFRNLLGNVKGTPALILTLVISIAVGEFTYYQSEGWFFGGLAGIGAGLIAAGVFKGAKLFGKNVVKIDTEKKK